MLCVTRNKKKEKNCGAYTLSEAIAECHPKLRWKKKKNSDGFIQSSESHPVCSLKVFQWFAGILGFEIFSGYV